MRLSNIGLLHYEILWYFDARLASTLVVLHSATALYLLHKSEDGGVVVLPGQAASCAEQQSFPHCGLRPSQ